MIPIFVIWKRAETLLHSGEVLLQMVSLRGLVSGNEGAWGWTRLGDAAAQPRSLRGGCGRGQPPDVSFGLTSLLFQM